MAELANESKKEKRERKKDKKEKKEPRPVDGAPAETSLGEVNEKSETSLVPESDEKAAEKSPEAGSDGNDDPENTLEIDLNAAVPLSHKKQRLLKKGKLDLDKIARKNPAPRPLTEDGEEPAPLSKKSPFGVWIGNLSFETTKEDIVRYIVARTTANPDLLSVEESDITRVNVPKKGDKIKGFAYVDLPSQEHVTSVVALSETNLNGRNLLIKSSSSFEGRPEDHGKKSVSKNPPSRILFVGNLSFDTTDELLEEHFKHCGEIVKIRMATFQDTGKCKGFAFVDFLNEAGATAALKSRLTRNFINRPLRLEYGEDRSKRNPKRQEKVSEGEISESGPSGAYRERESVDRPEIHEHSAKSDHSERPEARAPKKRPAERSYDGGQKRMKSSVALATAQRASAAIVPSQGKRKTFD